MIFISTYFETMPPGSHATKTNPIIVFLAVVNGEQLMMLSVVDINVFVAFV